MTSKIVQTTTKGQITLPMSWRKRFKTQHFVMEVEDEKITLKPLRVLNDEEILFDADRDHEGEGVPVKEMIRMLKKLS